LDSGSSNSQLLRWRCSCGKRAADYGGSLADASSVTACVDMHSIVGAWLEADECQHYPWQRRCCWLRRSKYPRAVVGYWVVHYVAIGDDALLPFSRRLSQKLRGKSVESVHAYLLSQWVGVDDNILGSLGCCGGFRMVTSL
jgi:hypothetical protein